MQPTVVVNHHRQTAIVIAKHGSKYEIIKLGKGRLTVSSLSAAELELQGYKACEYSPSQAAHSYLQHGAGVSNRAKKYLEYIARNKFSDTLTLT
ncbi:hypothetical protein [Nitrosomonas sp.]|uniref:hypothetical protein n=1 Tax=Nitrosomonas sp. TaxID=42353 RepID=UPI001D782937|nr:hypothetical protein [Nitrosomonas sp.]MCB1948996.1 hypothetical protein [Nitrosomonas sp.]MCP5243348.1 hypothetical protein [Burkholderiales bacterium]MDR4515060.1 hypothetical protein [Nitrosomonas sp.]